MTSPADLAAQADTYAGLVKRLREADDIVLDIALDAWREVAGS